MSGSSIVVKGQSRELLQQMHDKGLLTGEAMKRADIVLAENASLRRENAILKGRLAELRRLNKDYRRTHLEALNYQYDRERGWRYSAGYRRQIAFAAAGLATALTCLACSLALCL